MPVALPLTDRISQGARRTRRNRVRSAQFGDGYEQDAPDGINNLIDEWSLPFENLSIAERNTLVAALDAVGSWDYLTWTPPSDTAKKWKVTKDGWSETPMSGDLFSISVNVKQVF